jgi:hypothetical protein
LHDVGKIVTLLLKRKYPNIKELINMIDDSKVGSCLLRNWGFPENIVKIIECQYAPEFTNPEDIDQEFRYEISILYLSHRCYDTMLGVNNTETIFVDDFMELLGIEQKDYQTFYQDVILPALLRTRSVCQKESVTLCMNRLWSSIQRAPMLPKKQPESRQLWPHGCPTTKFFAWLPYRRLTGMG